VVKRASKSPLAPEAFAALKQVRQNLHEASKARAAAPPPKPKPRLRQVDDGMLFRRAMADVTPLPPGNRADLKRRKPKPVALKHHEDEHQALLDSLADPWNYEDALATGDELLFARPGVPNSALRKMRRGGWVVKAELDLHGMSSDEARLATAEFLNRCGRLERRCVRIIHGKGLGSKQRLPVLKNKLRHWLMQREDVLAFVQARAVDGGAGAVIVLLKSPD